MADQAEMQSPEERMIALLGEDVTDEATEEVPQEEEIQTEEPIDETVEESDEEQPEAIVKLKVNGEDVEKPLEEVIALAQQGLDYTQKTQKVAEERKEIETLAQTLKVQEQNFNNQVQLQNALIGDIAQITALDNQLEQFQKLDWNTLSDNDPVEAQKLFFRYNQLQTQRGQMVDGLNKKQSEIQTQKAEYAKSLIEKGNEVLSRDIPGWNQEKALEIRKQSMDYGFTEEELSSVTDPRLVKVLNDAIQWRKLQNNPVTKNKISEAKPVIKAGSKDTKTAQGSQTMKLSAELKRTGDRNLAAKLIERMI